MSPYSSTIGDPSPEQSVPIPQKEVTRLAPSPTGALHLGNARTFLVNWLLARQRGWRIILRIEDLDGPRNKPGADRDAIDTLQWLGIDWDEGPHYQAANLTPYIDAMRALSQNSLVYPCTLSRSQVEEAATAPQESAATGPTELGGDVQYSRDLRPRDITPGAFEPNAAASWRFVVPDRDVQFNDHFAGPQSHRPADTVGDFAIWTARHEPGYQLAVVVDDHRQGVTQIIRGDDLLDSAARQSLLYEALGWTPIPTYCHVPLIRGADGRRLAKRHGDTRIAHYRAHGAAPTRVLGLLAHWCGVIPKRAEISLKELLTRFDLAKMSRSPVVFGPEDDAWLLKK